MVRPIPPPLLVVRPLKKNTFLRLPLAMRPTIICHLCRSRAPLYRSYASAAGSDIHSHLEIIIKIHSSLSTYLHSVFIPLYIPAFSIQHSYLSTYLHSVFIPLYIPAFSIHTILQSTYLHSAFIPFYILAFSIHTVLHTCILVFSQKNLKFIHSYLDPKLFRI